MSGRFFVYMGFDPANLRAEAVARRSLLMTASVPVHVERLIDAQLRSVGLYYRPYRVEAGGQMFDERDGRPQSTQFSYTRFLVPYLHRRHQELQQHYEAKVLDAPWCLFCDSDVMFRDDVADLFARVDDRFAVMAVKHPASVACNFAEGSKKILGAAQLSYERKNWSSVMLVNSAHPANRVLTPELVSTAHRDWLHGLRWLEDDLIGELPKEWNWLDGLSPEISREPKLVHYTLGTPDMPRGERRAFRQEWWAYFEAGQESFSNVIK